MDFLDLVYLVFAFVGGFVLGYFIAFFLVALFSPQLTFAFRGRSVRLHHKDEAIIVMMFLTVLVLITRLLGIEISLQSNGIVAFLGLFLGIMLHDVHHEAKHDSKSFR